MNKALRLLLITDSFILISSAMFGPIYAIFVQEIGGGILEASWAVAVFSFITGISLYFFARFEDQMKEQELALVFGYFVLAIGYFGYLFVHSLPSLLLMQAILGIGKAVYTPAYDGLYSIHLDRKKAASQWGAWEMMAYIISGIGAVVGGLLANAFGFSILFVIMGMLCVFGAFVIWLQPRKVL